jgi:hypothetical protein
MYCLNATTGKLVWSYSLSYPYPINTSPAIANGRIYIVDGVRTIYCLPMLPILPGPASPQYSAEPGHAQLSWAPVTTSGNWSYSPTGYAIYRGSSSGTEIPYKTIGNQASFTDTDVMNGTTYYYTVRAIINGVEGQPSAEIKVTVPVPGSGMDLLMILVILIVISIIIAALSIIIARRHKNKSMTRQGKPGKNKVSSENFSAPLPSLVLASPVTVASPIDLAPSMESTRTREEIATLGNFSLDDQAIAEQEKRPEVNVKKCIIHQGEINGLNYSCPNCHVSYCMPCATTLSKNGYGCRNCGQRINLSA